MEQKMIMVSIIILAILLIILSYCIGFAKGFNKAKSIDNEILEELAKKYKGYL